MPTKRSEGLTNVVKQTGMTQDAFNACLSNRALYDQVNQVLIWPVQKFGVDATPTFFVNGKKIEGEIMLITELDKLLEPMLKS